MAIDLGPEDRAFMQRALDLAAQGLYTTSPNPCVGCVLVNDAGEVIGEGFHAKAGSAHAEVEALKNVQSSAHGCTAYVTLEPCNHWGRTGPCTEALIAAGVRRVVYGMQDPNPQVAGSGFVKLENAGVACDGPLLEDQAKSLNVGFIKRMSTGRPYVRCKMAMSLDGRTAMASGESQWITGAEAREDVQALRARSCAIVSGVESIIQDDPSLTVRSARFGENPRQPLRVIVDSQLRTPPSSKLLSLNGETIIACCRENIKSQAIDGAELLALPNDSGRVCIEGLLEKLAERECNEILLETGATLAGAFLEKGLVDELVIYVAGKIMGSKARPLFELPFDAMSESIELDIQNVEAVGRDWKFTVKPKLLAEGI